ncbi:hypothetical protein [Paraburkholderia sp. J67]|uniref:hypothetical protein n=1 Tax=Paraburkholderia sp. J67 TaxID=2805435 RepID=UPI002ABD5406|nr:hypothetical protein [Paraburkholderia sp. J67]
MTDEELVKFREDGYKIHEFLRSEGAGPWELGRRYGSEIRIGVWPSQRALATAYSVSVSHVSRCIAIAELSGNIVNVFGGSDNLSFRIGEKLLRIQKSIGEAEMEQRAVFVKDLKLTRLADLIEMFSTGMVMSELNPRLSVVVEENYKTISIQGSDIKKLIPHIGRLEKAIVDFLVAVTESKACKRRAKAKSSRRARMRNASGAREAS